MKIRAFESGINYNRKRKDLYIPSESTPAQKMKVKIEINTREHFHHFDPIEVEHAIENTWFSGKTNTRLFCLEELLGTKMRALYQRKKGRDLFDLFITVKSFPQLKTERVIEVFQRYVSHDGQTISRAEFEANLKEKLSDPAFQGDIIPLLSENPQYMHTFTESAKFVLGNFISKLPTDPWKGA